MSILLADLARDWESAQTALSGVDVRKAEAWKMSDQQQIAASVERMVGFAKTNMELTAKLREWYVAAGLRGLAQLGLRREPQVLKSLIYCRE